MIKITDSLGIVILNPESDPSSVKITVRTAKDFFPQANLKCVVGSKNAELPEIKKHCPIVIGGKTITSLLDVGVRSIQQKWCLFVTSGTFLRLNTLKKHEYFCTSETDILFPVVDRKWTFDEATLNGLLLPTQVVKDIDPMGDSIADIKIAKLLWANKAIEMGYQFKAIVGARLI
jgi:hypothetical protein